LELADLIAKHGTPLSSAQLAIQTGTNAEFLYRVLRFAATLGMFKEVDVDKWDNTEMSRMTAKPEIASMVRSMIDLQGPVWSNLEKCVRTGKEVSTELHNGVDFWTYLKQHPDDARDFNIFMIGVSRMEIPLVAAAYDWSQFDTLIDMAGGAGHLLAGILQANQNVKGIVFDQPEVIDTISTAFISSVGLSNRVQCVPGSFFEDVKITGDGMILKSILHDWNDEECVKILKCCRPALQPRGKLLIVEWVLAEFGESRQQGAFADLVMMTHISGKERTESQWKGLLLQAGFHIEKIIPSTSASVIECSLAN